MVYRTDRKGNKQFLGVAKNKQSVVSSDNRNRYQKRESEKYAKIKEKESQDQKIQEEGLKGMEGFFKLFSPSTYVGAAARATAGNGTFAENVMSGSGFGNEMGNLVTDIVAPGAIQKMFKYGMRGTQILKPLANKAVSNTKRVLKKVEKGITAKKRIQSLQERLQKQADDYAAKKNKYIGAQSLQQNGRYRELTKKEPETHIFVNDTNFRAPSKRTIHVNWDRTSVENANRFSKKHDLNYEFEEQPFEKTVYYGDHSTKQIVKRPAIKIGYQPGVNTGPYKIYRFGDGHAVEGNTQLNIAGTDYFTPNNEKYNIFYKYAGDTTSGERTVSGIDPLINTINDNIAYLQETIPGFKPFGSSVGVANRAIVHNTHDIDGYITRKVLKQLQDRGLVVETAPGETYLYKVGGGKYGEAGNVDLNVLGIDQNGVLLNDRSREMYKQFFPFEYQQQAIRQRGNEIPYIRALDKDGNILTEEQLLDSYDPLTKTILDSGQIDFTRPTKTKHASRFLEYLAGDNPEAVHKALQYEAARAGENRYLFPKLNFGTPEENAELLQSIGFTGDVGTISRNPAKMQNVLDYWLLSARRNYRAFGAGDIDGANKSVQNIWRNATDWNASDIGSGGHLAGGGLNSTIDGDSGWYGDLFAYIQPKINGLEQITDPRQAIAAVNMANGIDNPIEVRNGILKMFGIEPDVAGSSTNLLKVLPRSGEREKQIYEQVAQKYGINALAGDPYGNGIFSGIIRKLNPETDSVGIQLYDRSDLYPSWSSRMKKSSKNNPFVGTYTGYPTDYRPPQYMQDWFESLFKDKEDYYNKQYMNSVSKKSRVDVIDRRYSQKKEDLINKGVIGGVGAMLGIPGSYMSYKLYEQYKRGQMQRYYKNLIGDYEQSLYNTLRAQHQKLGGYGSEDALPGNDYKHTYIYPDEAQYIIDHGQEGSNSIMQQKIKPIK